MRQSLSLGYSGAETALEDYRSLEIRENAYRKSLEVYRALYEAETITTVDLLQQANNYINVVYQFVQSKYGYMLRRRMLDIYMKAGL